MAAETGKFRKTDHSKSTVLNICTYNIQHGGNARLEAAMRAIRQMNMDLGILTETKLVEGLHTTNCEGYEIISTKAKSQHQGGVALFCQTSKEWHLEGTQTFGPNVIKTILVSGRKRWTIVGAYIPPSEEDNSTLDCIQTATSRLDSPLILLGDLNVDIHQIPNQGYNQRQEETLALIASLDLSDLKRHFTPRKRIERWKEWTWSQKRNDGTRIRSVCDYILTQERSQFRYFQLKEPRFDSDHRLLHAKLQLNPIEEHRSYVQQRTKPPVSIPSNRRSRSMDN